MSLRLVFDDPATDDLVARIQDERLPGCDGQDGLTQLDGHRVAPLTDDHAGNGFTVRAHLGAELGAHRRRTVDPGARARMHAPAPQALGGSDHSGVGGRIEAEHVQPGLVRPPRGDRQA